jgi:hypothetical protein
MPGKHVMHTTVWRIDEDANLAVPFCQSGDALDAFAVPCDPSDVTPKTIDCPECRGSAKCTHCGPDAICVACSGTHQCDVCDGTGRWHGEMCPVCSGAKSCTACAAGAVHEPCERCGETHVCANCEGVGAITLR